MRGFRTLLWLAAVALVAPAVAQNELPSAPSAVKQPPPPNPQPEPAKASPPPQPAAPTPSKDGGSAPATPAPAANEGPPLETIVKRVDEVNVVFTVTDKRKRFVK